MSSEVTARDNRQFRAGDNIYQLVTVKGADPTTFEPAQSLQYDPADEKYFVFVGGAATDSARALLNIDEDFVMAGVTEKTFSVMIGGKFFVDKITLPVGLATIDDIPTLGVLSLREQFREVGLIAVDSEEALEDHITNP